MIPTEKLQRAAKWYVSKGLSVFPLAANDKRPIASWTQYQSGIASLEDVSGWSDGNLALATGKLSGVVVVDCESRKDAEWFFNERGQTLTVVQTRRGFHLYFRYPEDCEVGNAAKVKDESGRARYDVRGEGGYVVAPPSVVSDWTYQFVFSLEMVERELLPVFKPEWMPKQTNGVRASRVIHDGLAYISKIQAVSGQGGHNETWKAVNCLKDSGMSETEALAALAEWNHTNAEPPWSMGELLHKVQDCYGGR